MNQRLLSRAIASSTIIAAALVLGLVITVMPTAAQEPGLPNGTTRSALSPGEHGSA